MSQSEFEPTLTLKHLIGFGWIDAFLQWPVLFRLPAVSAVVLPLIVLPLYMGTSLQDFMLLLVQITMTSMTLAVYVILARGAQSDFSEGGESGIRQNLEPPFRQPRSKTCCRYSLDLPPSAFSIACSMAPGLNGW